MRHGCNIIAALLLCFMALAALADAAPKHLYKVAVDAEYAPYEFRDVDGKVKGMLPDMLRAIGKSAGVEFRFIPMNWPDAVKALEQGRVDILNMIRTPERLGKYEFSNPHTMITQALFRNKSETEIQGVHSIAGHIVALQRSDIANERLARRQNFDRRMVNSKSEGFLKLNAGEVDAYFTAEQPGLFFVQQHEMKHVELAAVSLWPQAFCFTARKGSRAVVVLLNKGLARLKHNGSYGRIVRQWSIRPEGWVAHHTTALIAAAAILLLATLGLWLWVFMLRRTVNMRTRDLVREHELLQLQSMQWEATFDAVGDGIILIDSDKSAILRSNRAFKQMQFAMVNMPCGQPCHEMLLGNEVLQDACLHCQARKLGRAVSSEVYEAAHNQWLSVSTFPLPNQLFGKQHCVVVIRDVSGQRASRMALEQNRSELLKAQEIARISSWAFEISPGDKNHKFQVETGHIFGFPDDFDYTYRACIKQVHADDRQLVRRSAKKVIRGEALQDSLQFRVIGIRDGVIRHVQMLGDSEFEEGRLVRVFGTAQDISDNIHLGEMNQAVVQAQADSKAKGDFLAVMSHELRTPLHGIIGLQDLLAQELTDIPVRQKKHLALAQHSAHILSSLIDDILNLSKIESGAMELNPCTFDLQQLLRNALLIFLAQVQQKGVELMLQLDAIPRYVFGDEGKIRQILLNLIGNAVKFTAEGSIQLDATYDCQHDDGRLIIEISDTGIGITRENMAILFDPFKQCDMRADCQGTGLGTTIARKFARMMKGDISVQSEAGVGSVFTINLPLKFYGDERISQELSMHAFVLPTDRCPSVSVSLNELHVLLAEDDAVARFLAMETLQSAGLRVDAVENGLIAWQRLQHGDYDVLLTDILMPGIDGIELTQKVRALEKEQGKERGMIIIGLSAYAMSHVENRAYDAGMNAFVSKPVEVTSITARLALLCEQPACGD